MKKFFTLWVPVIFWAAFIFYLSSIPHLRLVQGWWDYPIRKAAHMTVYAILARLLARALTQSTRWSWKRIFVVSLVGCALYACTDEYHQTFVAGRHGSPRDIGFDSAGAWLALGLTP